MCVQRGAIQTDVVAGDYSRRFVLEVLRDNRFAFLRHIDNGYTSHYSVRDAGLLFAATVAHCRFGLCGRGQADSHAHLLRSLD